MEENDGHKLHKLEDLKSKLFSKNYKPKVEYRDGFSPRPAPEVSDAWEPGNIRLASNRFFAQTSLFKKIFIAAAVFFILSLGYAVFMLLAGGNLVSNENIEISVAGNNFIGGGEELELVVSITNKNTASLDLVDLVIEYPKGAAENLDQERRRISLGTIPAGAVRNESLKLVLFGEQGSIRPIKLSIEYRVAGSNAIFVKEKIYNININSTPINLSVEGPLSVSPNQGVNLNIRTSLNATRPAEDVLVTLDYPLGFQFLQAVPSPAFGNNVWFLGDLAPGAEHSIAISGKMIDVFDGEEKTFNITSGSQSLADKSAIDVVFNSIRHTIEIKRAFIEASIAINGVSRREYAVDSDTPLNVEILYANNLSTKVDNLAIEAKISGNAWNRSTVRASQGHYDSAYSSILWDRSFVRALGEINPGDSGLVSFSIEPLPLLSASGGLLSDPFINIEVNFLGQQSVQDASVTELQNSASAVLRVISDVGFSAKALYYSGAFPNTGSIPPKAEETTTYTIVWTLSNTSNNISRAQLTATLPAWVNFLGPVSPAGENLTYNALNRTVVWNIDRIPKGTGITTAARSVSFQVSFKPSLSQVGSTPALMGESLLTGYDDFAKVEVTVSRNELNTRLLDDPLFPGSGGVVAP